MRLLITNFVLVCIGAALVSVSHAKRWNTNKDSIIVDAHYAGEVEDDQPFADEPVGKVECFTMNKEPGECVPMIRCHPIFFSDKGQVRNSGLALTYAQYDDVCETQNSLDGNVETVQIKSKNTDLGNRVICCAKDRIQYNLRSGIEEEYDLYTTTIEPAGDPEVFAVTTGVPTVLSDDVSGTTQIPQDDLLVVDTVDPFNSKLPPIPVVDFEIIESAPLPTGPPAKGEVQSFVVSATNRPEQEESVPFTTTRTQSLAEDIPVPEPEIPLSEPEVSISEPEVPASEPVSESESIIPEPVPELVAAEDVLEQAPPTDACPSTASYRTWPAFETYPWLAAIQTTVKTGPTCAGSLITESHIITAAHCLHRFNSKDVAKMQIRVGFSRNSENDTFNDFYLERKASKIIFHKRFHEQSKMDNNIALIKLDQPIEFDDHVAPIGIFNGLQGFDSGNCTAVSTGWIKFGNRKVTGASGGVIHFIEAPMSDFHLRESLSRVYSNKECSESLSSQITDKMLCAKSELFEEPKVSTDFFRWNDGGPLVLKVGNMIQQVGIKSWAYEGHSHPTVYTNVNSYLSWIRENLKM